MARFFRRRDFDVFPHIYMGSAVLGVCCGYIIGEWSGKSRMRELIRNERIVDRLFMKANEDKRKLMRDEDKKNEILRDVQSLAKLVSEKERALQQLEKQLKERERKVERAENKIDNTSIV